MIDAFKHKDNVMFKLQAINFIIAPQTENNGNDQWLRKLMGTLYKNHVNIACLTASEKDSERIDELLWQENTPLLPHAIGKIDKNSDQIHISHNVEDIKNADIIVNLTNNTIDLAYFSTKQLHLIEWVNASNKTSKREHYRYYLQTCNIKPQTIDSNTLKDILN